MTHNVSGIRAYVDMQTAGIGCLELCWVPGIYDMIRF